MSITMSDGIDPLKTRQQEKHGFPILEDAPEEKMSPSEIPEIFIIDNGPIFQIDLPSFDRYAFNSPWRTANSSAYLSCFLRNFSWGP